MRTAYGFSNRGANRGINELRWANVSQPAMHTNVRTYPPDLTGTGGDRYLLPPHQGP